MVQIESDVYSQIGLVMLIGLAAKNAILIVEFAKDEHEKGKPLADAALEGAKLRLRPILMTSFAFILGCVPLWTASGAGSVARQVMGTTVIGGMLAASAIGIFFVPAIYYLVERFSSASSDGEGSVRRCFHRRSKEIEMKHRAIAVLIATSFLTNCTVGPDYHRPAVQVPQAFHAPEPLPTAQAASFADLKWWEVFRDEELQRSSKPRSNRTTICGMR
jgi:predicted RND superfamily exporter protein